MYMGICKDIISEAFATKISIIHTIDTSSQAALY